MKKLTTIIIAFACFSFLHAENPAIENGFASGGAGGFDVGITLPQLTELNKVINDNTGKEISIPMLTTGGSGWAVVNRIVMGGGGGGFEQRITGDSVEINFSYGYGFFAPGYALISKEKFQLHLLAGFGGSGATIFIKPASYGGVTLDSIIKNPATSSEITWAGISVYPAIRTTLQFGFIGLSLKAGYLYNFQTKWELKGGGTLINPPEDNLAGFLGSVGIFFGGFSK